MKFAYGFSTNLIGSIPKIRKDAKKKNIKISFIFFFWIIRPAAVEAI